LYCDAVEYMRQEERLRLSYYCIETDKRVHVEWWAQEFHVSPAVLLAAIQAVGNKADVVAGYLNKRDAMNGMNRGGQNVAPADH